MRRAAISLAFAACMTLAAFPARGWTDQNQAQKKEQKKPKSDSASLTGCIDEHDGRYVLIDDRNRAPIANLEAEGFPTEGFAKHLGHKVTVRGTSSPAPDRPLFRVRSIETVSESCEPQPLN
jgi:hypothetical protein